MPDPIPYVDCQGLAGAWTLGTVQTGEFSLVHRVALPGGFGNDPMLANREFFPGWEGESALETGLEETWTPQDGIGYLNGTPPCSGFSLLNTSKGSNSRGAGADINSCMKDLVTYAGKCTGLDGGKGPEIVSFESVQQAFTTGRRWMQELRDELELVSGQRYDLTHVLMSGASVGSAQMRHRYYPVFHRVPFGVQAPEKRHVVTYQDALGDLHGAAMQWEAQAYPSAPLTDYQRALRANSSVLTGHIAPTTGAFFKIIEEIADYWYPGERLDQAIKRYGKYPANIKHKKRLYEDGAIPQDAKIVLEGWSWPVRVAPDRPGFVLTGGGIISFVHYLENRFPTVREISRLMGYPDDWTWTFAGSPSRASMYIGKCCPVQSGKWISQQVAGALRAYEAGERVDAGDVVAASAASKKYKPDLAVDREFLHDSTQVYKSWLKEQQEVQA